MIATVARAWKLALAWTLSLVAVGTVASVLTAAQASPPPTLGLRWVEITEGTTIVSGSDIGFRIERTLDGVPVGTLVVRVEGRWVEAGTSVRVAVAK
jgi:hypothetical protein